MLLIDYMLLLKIPLHSKFGSYKKRETFLNLNKCGVVYGIYLQIVLLFQ